MNQTDAASCDPFLAALRELPGTRLVPTFLAEALLHLSAHAADGVPANLAFVPPQMKIDGQAGYLADDLVRYMEQEPTRCHPIRTRHRSFSDFLTCGQPDEVWAFGMVALDFHGMKRPVDILTCLELPATMLAHAHHRDMTLREYVETVDRYLSQFQGQQEAEALATERAQLSFSDAPKGAAKRRPLNGNRS